MESIDRIFNNLDKWRNFPSYQLERRADIFFSLYLPEVLEKHFDVPMHPVVIPEFPAYKPLLSKPVPGDKKQEQHRSYRIDYVAFSKNLSHAWLVELKTDSASRRVVQNEYLAHAKAKGFAELTNRLKTIFTSKHSHKRKYFHLLLQLSELGMIEIPQKLTDIMQRKSIQGATAAAGGIMFKALPKETSLVYVLPRELEAAGDSAKSKNSDSSQSFSTITFNQVIDAIAHHGDSMSQRFIKSLSEWAEIPAGTIPQEP